MPKSCKILILVCNQAAKSRYIVMFVSKKMSNNVVMSQLLIVLTVLIDYHHNEEHQALWHHRIDLHLFRDEQTSKSHQAYSCSMRPFCLRTFCIYIEMLAKMTGQGVGRGSRRSDREEFQGHSWL